MRADQNNAVHGCQRHVVVSGTVENPDIPRGNVPGAGRGATRECGTPTAFRTGAPRQAPATASNTEFEVARKSSAPYSRRYDRRGASIAGPSDVVPVRWEMCLRGWTRSRHSVDRRNISTEETLMRVFRKRKIICAAQPPSIPQGGWHARFVVRKWARPLPFALT